MRGRRSALGVQLRRPGQAAREVVALLRLAALDAKVGRLEDLARRILGLLEKQRSDLADLSGVIEEERAQLARGEATRGQLALALPREREASYADLAAALEKDEADALALFGELQRTSAVASEERERLAERISSSVLKLYAAARCAGRRSALAGVRDGVCSGCQRRLPAKAEAEILNGNGITACPFCIRLVYDQAWLERDFKPLTLRPVPRDAE